MAMTKVYQLMQKRNNSSFILYGKGGNAVQYAFKGGNVISNQPATFVTSNEYYQRLLEESELFKKGVVRIDPLMATAAAREAAERKAKEEAKKNLTKIEDVKSVAQAVEYCAEKWGEVVKNTKQAQACANEHGCVFVNLKVKE